MINFALGVLAAIIIALLALALYGLGVTWVVHLFEKIERDTKW